MLLNLKRSKAPMSLSNLTGAHKNKFKSENKQPTNEGRNLFHNETITVL